MKSFTLIKIETKLKTSLKSKGAHKLMKKMHQVNLFTSTFLLHKYQINA